MKNFLLFFLSLHVYAVDEELLNAIDQNYAFKEQIVFSNNIEQFSSGYLIRSENEVQIQINEPFKESYTCLLYTSPSPRDCDRSRMPSSA